MFIPTIGQTITMKGYKATYLVTEARTEISSVFYAVPTGEPSYKGFHMPYENPGSYTLVKEA